MLLDDLNLLRMAQVANERTVRELGSLPLGGLPITSKRRPAVHPVKTTDTIKNKEEDEAMKVKQMVVAAVLVAGTAACNPATPASASTNAASTEHPAQTQKPPVSSLTAVVASPSTNYASAKTSAPRLGPEYKKIDSFVEFRKKLIADGWKPVVNPHCLEELVGVDYKDDCSKDPNDISCRACDMVPEIFIYTSQGYLTTRYVKDGTPLYVGSYGDIQDLDQPGRYGLSVMVWDYKYLN
jgi:hypothetical protein